MRYVLYGLAGAILLPLSAIASVLIITALFAIAVWLGFSWPSAWWFWWISGGALAGAAVGVSFASTASPTPKKNRPKP